MSLKPICRSVFALNHSFLCGTNQTAICAGKRCLFASSNKSDLDALFNANQKSMTTSTGRFSYNNPFMFIHKYSSRNRYLIKKLDLFDLNGKKSRPFSSNSTLRTVQTDKTKSESASTTTDQPDANQPSSNDNQANSNFQNGNKIESALLARQFISTLTINERVILKEELIVAEKETPNTQETPGKIEPVKWNQLLMVCLQNGLPFIGFGFVDNFLMIVAGDLIESTFGMFLPISTMAAAGLGNAVSDVAGIGLAHHIDYMCSKLISVPKLTPEQWNQPVVHWFSVISKGLCIFIGCLIGMTPLLFIDHKDKAAKKTESSEEQKTE